MIQYFCSEVVYVIRPPSEMGTYSAWINPARAHRPNYRPQQSVGPSPVQGASDPLLGSSEDLIWVLAGRTW